MTNKNIVQNALFYAESKTLFKFFFAIVYLEKSTLDDITTKKLYAIFSNKNEFTGSRKSERVIEDNIIHLALKDSLIRDYIKSYVTSRSHLTFFESRIYGI